MSIIPVLSNNYKLKVWLDGYLFVTPSLTHEHTRAYLTHQRPFRANS